MYNRIKQTLRNNKGSTILYVMAIMLLLLGIGISVLTAAAANVGYTQRQKDHTQASILADSMHRTIMVQLQNEEVGNLSEQLINALYTAYIAETNGSVFIGKLSDFDLNWQSDIEINPRYTIHSPIQVQFNEQHVRIEAGVPAIPDLNIERIPTTAYASATMTVSVTIDIHVRNQENPNRITTIAEYQLVNVTLIDGEAPNDFATSPTNMSVNPNSSTRWELIRYESREQTPSS